MWGEVLVGFAAAFVIWFVFSLLFCKGRSDGCQGNGEKPLPPGSMGLPFIGETLQYVTPFKSSTIGPFLHERMSRYNKISSNCVKMFFIISCSSCTDLQLRQGDPSMQIKFREGLRAYCCMNFFVSGFSISILQYWAFLMVGYSERAGTMIGQGRLEPTIPCMVLILFIYKLQFMSVLDRGPMGDR